MVDTLVLGTSGEIRGSSSLPWGTMILSLVSLMVELRLYTAVAAVQFCHEVPSLFGVWRSLVAHLVWDQGVQGSNPCTPTMFYCLVAQLVE